MTILEAIKTGRKYRRKTYSPRMWKFPIPLQGATLSIPVEDLMADDYEVELSLEEIKAAREQEAAAEKERAREVLVIESTPPTALEHQEELKKTPKKKTRKIGGDLNVTKA